MAHPRSRPPSLLTQPSYLASQVSKYGRRHLEVVLEQHDLTLAHYALLGALDDFGPRSQQQLADSLDFDKSHVVAPIDQLERSDLVTRTQDPSDRRRNQVALTAAGKALIARLQPVGRRSQQGFLETLSTTEQKTLISLLQRVLAANDAARLTAEDPTPSPEPSGERARTRGRLAKGAK